MLKNLTLVSLALIVLAGGVYYFVAHRSSKVSVDLGVPLYPGAEIEDGGSIETRLSNKEAKKSFRAVMLQTVDPVPNDIAFYKANLEGRSRLLETMRDGLPTTIFHVDFGRERKIIAVSKDKETGKTQISIASVDRSH